MLQASVEGRGDRAAVRCHAVVESIDVGLQALGDFTGALPHAIDDFAAIGFDGVIEFGNMAGDEGTQCAAVACEPLGEIGALVPHQFIEGIDLQAQ